jgi:RNA polymerase sigma factor (sigma-70 family)
MASAQLGTVLRQLRTAVHARAYEDAGDGELLDRFLARREEAAFVALLRRHGPMVLHVGRRVLGNAADAEDVFQATFLLLARKADSIRNQGSLAAWLHGVAHRLALAARAQGLRRQARERRAADMRRTSTVADGAWQELQAALEEALRQVPEKYRTPLLLCYLQGLTQEEAARHLGCPLGTVRSRLARGRERLKEVLVRRGVRLSAVALAAALAANAAPAAVPAALLGATTGAVLGYAAGIPPAALVSARAARLLDGGLHAMTTVKLKIATAIVLVLGGLGLGAAALAPHVLAAAPPAPAAVGAADKAAGSAPAPGDDPAARNEGALRGRVLGSDGQPLTGARLLLLGEGDKTVDLGASAADGRFTVAVPKGRQGRYLVARADGAGLDFLDLEGRHLKDPVELRLVKDHAIRGRVVDTQGRPVAGVRVTAGSLNVYPDNSLDSFLAAWKKRHFQSGIPGGVKHLWEEAGALFRTTTDAEGRFVVRGAGAERLVSFRLSGAGIADAEAWVVNRPGFDPKPYNEATFNNIPKGLEGGAIHWLLYGPDLAVVAEAEKPIRGAVTEADTGKGRPGVEVLLTRNGDELVPIILKAKTDAAGRYEIHGARKAKAYMVEVKSDPAAGYLPRQARAADTPGYAPVTIDLRVARGVIVTGRVIDKTTGQSVPGFAMAAVLSDNPFVKNYPEFNSSAWIRLGGETDGGSFRVVTIPGPVLLMGGPDPRRLPGGWLEYLKYRPPLPDPKYPHYFSKEGDGTAYFTVGGGISPIQGNFCKVLEIKPGTPVVKEDVVLESLRPTPVKIQDVEGRPLSGAWVTGISPRDWASPVQVDKDSCPAYGVEAGKPRLMAFYHPGKKLFGTLTLKGEKGPAVVRLGPGGAVKGRLLDANGKPLRDVVVEAYYMARVASEIHDVAHRANRVVTDAGGAFRIDELIPGLEFKLFYQRGKPTFDGTNTVLDKTLRVSPAAPLDLGDVKLKPAPPNNGE